ncbi:MAG TPA: peptidoglycan editing factor PgeF [Rhizomicrobium sp.]|nr:peptidoglycan editing factor PgeF [Rhizomicrobium sp.]
MFVLKAKNLPEAGHGFFGRQGGVSTGIFASLNCGPGSGDDIGDVTTNRGRVRDALGAAHLVNLHQAHGAKAVTVTASWELGRGPEADAMATKVPGIALGILTADCAPVLLHDPQAGVIGAAHAGWKGALAGVIDSALEAMQSLGAVRERVAAAVGPCISQASYEVDDDFHSRFRAADPDNGRFFRLAERAGHFRFDLEGYVVHRLRESGVARVEGVFRDTYTHESEFFSYRRATHRGEKNYGRQLSAIVLPGASSAA